VGEMAQQIVTIIQSAVPCEDTPMRRNERLNF